MVDAVVIGVGPGGLVALGAGDGEAWRRLYGIGQPSRAEWIAALLITRDLGMIVRYADQVAVRYAGRIVETGPVGLLFHRMRHRYTEAPMAAVPRRDQDNGTALYSIPGLPRDLSDLPLITLSPGHQHACWHPVDYRGELPSAINPPVGCRFRTPCWLPP